MRSQRSSPRSQKIGRRRFARWRRRERSSGRARSSCCRRQRVLQLRWSRHQERRRCNRRIMAKRYLVLLWLVTFPFYGGRSGDAQDDASRIRVSVVLVQLNIAVTDDKGNYISGLRPEDFSITEDKIPEKTATFEEGNGPPRR